MEKINVELFKLEWDKINSLLDEIWSIPKPEDHQGNSCDGFEFDEDGITIKSSTYFSGCGQEDYSHLIKWQELEQPIDYFRIKYDNIMKQYAERKKAALEAKEREKKESELKQLKELQKKYGIQP